MTVTLHVQTVDQLKAIKMTKGKISDIDKMKVEEQKKAVRAGYDMEILPPDLITYSKDAAALLADLQSRNERMFLLTFTVVNIAPTRQKLENDVFTISGRGTVATGRVERGQLKAGETVEIVGLTDEKRTTVVTSMEMFHKTLDYVEAGDNAGCLLRGVAKTDIERGQVLCKPGSIHPYTKFVGQVYVLSKDEGGRHTPFFNNYRPQFYFRTTDVTGVISLPEGTEMCMPGDNVVMNVELITPIAIEEGLRFAIREGGRTVGSGVVTAINE